MIKKYKYLLIFILLFTSKSHALSPQYEKELYIGCYTNSKQYLGNENAKIYCQCTITRDGLLDEALINPHDPSSKENLTPFTVKTSVINCSSILV